MIKHSKLILKMKNKKKESDFFIDQSASDEKHEGKRHEIQIEKKKSNGTNPFLQFRVQKNANTEKACKSDYDIDKNILGVTCSNVFASKTEIPIHNFSNSDFFTSLVDAYLDCPEYINLFEIKDKLKFNISKESDKTILTFWPKSEKSNDIMMKAISCVESILPFTANSILCHQNYPNCAIEVIVNNAKRYETLVHLINNNNKNLPTAFNINKEVIEFLCTKIRELASSKNLYRIALTGEALSFSLDDAHRDERYNKIRTSMCDTVFGQPFYQKNRLILLVSKDAEIPKNQNPLKWVIQTFSEEEELIQIASNLVKGIRAYHIHDLFIMKESPEFKYEGSDDHYFDQLLNGRNSKISEICQKLHDDYTRHLLLTQEIPISQLKYSENEIIFQKREELKQINDRLEDLHTNIKRFDKYEYEKKKDRHNELTSKLKKFENYSNKNPTKIRLINEKKDIENYFHQYTKEKNEIHKLTEKKSELRASISSQKDFQSKLESEGIKGRLLSGFGCYYFSSDQPIPCEKDEFIETKLKEIAKKQRIKIFGIEKLVSATIFVSHHSTSPYSPSQLEEIVSNVCKKFSFIVPFCSKYKPRDNDYPSLTGQIGGIYIEVIYPKFALTVVSEIKQAILGTQLNIFRIPKNIASKKMLLNKVNQQIIQNWLQNNRLYSISYNGENWIGNKEDVSKAYELLRNDKTCVEFKQKVITISSNLKKREVWKIIENYNQNHLGNEPWDFDDFTNCLIVGNNESEIREARILISNLESKKSSKTENDLFGCIDVCTNQIKSELPITIYQKDGNHITNYLCSECIMSILDYNLNCFFEDKFGIDFETLMSTITEVRPICIINDSIEEGDEYWPKVPIGQLLWNLVNDNNFSDKAKVWLTEVLYLSLHRCIEHVTFCPNHPYIILPRPKVNEKLLCSLKECDMILCPFCNQWHPDGKCSNFKWDKMRCPGCGMPTEKSFGCNHIACPCGTHWCYKCGMKFTKEEDVYSHMTQMHGGYFE